MKDAIPTAGLSQDTEAELSAQVREAHGDRRRLSIRGTGTKAFYGNPCRAEAVLDCSGHRGIVYYEPSELAITVRSGTPLAEVESLLAEQGQRLPFEPPRFGSDPGGGTLGGMIACGLSGPRRPYAGSLRDAVLGVRILNGTGEVMQFGGQVMKNVAGYDISRLMAGSLGVLGVLLEVSLKVTPIPPGTLSLVHELPLTDALERLRRWARRPLPMTASAWHNGRLTVRLCGSEEALAESHRVIGGLPLEHAEQSWRELRDHRYAFFRGDGPLWRVCVKPSTAASDLPFPDDRQLVEWGGALRWVSGDKDPSRLRAAAKAAGGHASLFRVGAGPAPADGVFSPLDPVRARLHRELKGAFDPRGLFNPGRLYPDL